MRPTPSPHRRALLRGLPAAGALGALGLGPWTLALAAPTGFQARAPLLGTWVRVHLPEDAGTADPQAAWDAARQRMQALEAEMTRYRDDSAVAALAAQAGRGAWPVSAELFAVLQHARRLWRESGGAFDPTVGALAQWHFESPEPRLPSPQALRQELALVGAQGLRLDPARRTAALARPGMRLDLGGVAKLPILAAGLQALQDHGVRRALLDGGGDVLALGRDTDAPWQIGLRDPLRPEQLLAVLPLRRGVVASSGDYERGWTLDGRRYHHVLDPHTGYPSQGVHGVSLVADTVDAVNGLGAAAMVLGPARGPDWLAARAPQALLQRADGRLWVSPALAARLRPPPGQDRIRGLA